MRKIIVLIWCFAYSLFAIADDEVTTKTFQACSTVYTEVFTGLQLYQKGLDLESLYKTLPGITEKGKKRLKSLYINIAKNGLTEIYSQANSEYSSCSKDAYKNHGKPVKNTLPYLFYVCAGENKLRYEIILAFYLGAKFEDIASQVHPTRKQTAAYLYNMYTTEGINETFSFSATELKRCLTQ